MSECQYFANLHLNLPLKLFWCFPILATLLNIYHSLISIYFAELWKWNTNLFISINCKTKTIHCLFSSRVLDKIQKDCFGECTIENLCQRCTQVMICAWRTLLSIWLHHNNNVQITLLSIWLHHNNNVQITLLSIWLHHNNNVQILACRPKTSGFQTSKSISRSQPQLTEQIFRCSTKFWI